MDELRRKSTHSSNEFLNNSKPHHEHVHGFVNKLVADIKKLYVYEPNQIKWMNEKPGHRKAYEPTEVTFY